LIRENKNKCTMSIKHLLRWLLPITMLLAATFIYFAVSTSSVLADCGTSQKSSCISCHAPDGHVKGMGEWNSVHLNQDMCTNCHGGNGSSMNKDLAHAGIVAQPLSDIYTDCHSCHPDYDVRAQIFASTLGITPGSCATPTPVPVNNTSGEPPSGGISVPTKLSSTTTSSLSFLVAGAMLSILILFLFALVWIERHHI
jgi:hypothetical protein